MFNLLVSNIFLHLLVWHPVGLTFYKLLGGSLNLLFSEKQFIKTFLQAAAAVNITSTLVLMTIMMQLKSSLPKSTPNTLLDVWMIFCLSSTASILYCHIWIEYFSKEAKHVQPNKVKQPEQSQHCNMINT